ncbi:mycothiol system anti-sigma-R factor [Prescottella equi]|uniref:mycothiol system anti-sigma-R factor n=1 Tax=Rhodococcus hoagii TaxID=43767 RepID=UPI0023DAF5F5|nr:mycothiol system anti-sigma-R factor [Prescottella equi]
MIADVWLLLDSECDEHSRARIEHHLETCGACFAAYGIEEKVKRLIGRKCGGDHAPAGLRERLSIDRDPPHGGRQRDAGPVVDRETDR